MLCPVRGSVDRQVGSGSRSSGQVGQGGEGEAGWSACPTTTTQSCEIRGAVRPRYLSAEPLNSTPMNSQGASRPENESFGWLEPTVIIGTDIHKLPEEICPFPGTGEYMVIGGTDMHKSKDIHESKGENI